MKVYGPYVRADGCMQAANMLAAQVKNTFGISNPVLICVPKGYKR